jgi:peptide/nickel transport system substrate-binding protein
MAMTWKIRPNARWHDGTPFTSDDAAFTTAVWFDDDLPVFRNPAHTYIDAVTTPDLQTVIVTWKQPYIRADAFFNTPILPRHLLERTYLERKAALLDSPYWTSEFVGTGPYKLKDWETGSHALLQFNEAYVLGAPRIGEIEVKFFVDPNTLMANILAGTVAVTIGRSVTLDQGLDLREHWRDGAVQTRAAGWYTVYPQMLNPTPTLVLDPRLRHALWHGIDRSALVDTFHGGLSTVADVVIGMDEPEYREIEPQIVRHPYDTRRAGQYLEELGYRRAADGTLRDGSGAALALETTSTFDDMNTKLHFAIADYWRQLGLSIESTIIPVQRVQDQQLRATYPSFEIIGQPHGIEQFQRLHSSQARTPERSFTGSNNARYMDPTLDRLIESHVTTIPHAERSQIAGQIVRVMTGDALWMGLFYRGEPTMIANNLQNVGVGPTRSTQVWNVHLWDLK